MSPATARRQTGRFRHSPRMHLECATNAAYLVGGDAAPQRLHMGTSMLRRYAFAAVAALLAGPAAAAQRFGDFVVYPDTQDVITLDAAIGRDTIRDFKRAVAERPWARVVLLDSPGGRVDQALELANEIEQRGMSTAIPRGMGCYSACAYVFFAGREHVVEGRLGVHQISAAGEGDLAGTVAYFGTVHDTLKRLEVPDGVIKAMLKTPPTDVYVFTDAEIDAMSINRSTSADSLALKYATTRPPKT
jgi:hypothetical protein